MKNEEFENAENEVSQEQHDGDATQEPQFPKVVPDDLENEIAMTSYINAGHATDSAASSSLRCLTICILTLKNGFTVLGQSACVDRRNYDKALGEGYARADAVKKLWPLLGFRLADKLYGARNT